MTQDDRVLGVFKFGASAHIEQFVQGVLYMNTLEHFVKVEAGSLRNDSHEGTSHRLRGDGAVLYIKTKIEEEFKPICEIKTIRLQPDDLKNVNVFCMYALREGASDAFVDLRNFDFGDTFALLIDFDEFLKRVNAAVPSTGQHFQSHLVEYIDETSYLGAIGIFKKPYRFSFQSEFRIALLPGTGAALRFEVGNLSDIIITGRLSELNERLKVQVNDQEQRVLRIKI